ncbi:MAG: hypothetical protein ACI87E_004019 [Mariniblastus sp.]|jgi:hypothetical protein
MVVLIAFGSVSCLAIQPLPTAPSEFELVPDGEFLELQFPEAEASRELQLVLDPEFL